MERKDNQSSKDEAGGILVEFLEVAITSIVFLKGMYPPGAFERRKYMNLVVHRARHPELRDYIHSAVFGVFMLLGLLPNIKKVGDNGILSLPSSGKFEQERRFVDSNRHKAVATTSPYNPY